MTKKEFFKGIVFFLVSLLTCFFVINLIVPKLESQLKPEDFIKKENKTLQYIAIGDSLTEGVGDSTNQGGFVPLLSKDLEDLFAVKVNFQNYGVSGNTSQQILKRMSEKQQIKDDLKKADLMTLTVGGNDVLAIIRKNLSNLKLSSFEKPSTQYQARLKKIIDLSRKENKDIKIYVLGIYNPFYLNFPEMTEMQAVVDNWNQKTEDIITEYDDKNIHFVPINEQLYKGINGQEGIVQSEGDKTRVLNDVLFTGDHFHPNNIGYQIMSDAVLESIKKYEKK
ncbi:SGNH/GDSL hydrolase family protein [Streptococcus didelphis]|uniref:SGNH/GDSL hydrolase family protein n=1 Tax=Streptococcus didelphis TaxID=102886 RepID=UPI0003646676|nr:SGNH/GDSL hydrolase family protein [Streptococcus didelphis]